MTCRAQSLILVTRWMSFDEVASFAKHERCFTPVIVRDTHKKQKGYAYCVARVKGHDEWMSRYYDIIQLNGRYEVVGKVV
jgi:hypothetical protein